MICPQCNASNDDTSKFCYSCGFNISSVSSQTQETPTEDTTFTPILTQEVASSSIPVSQNISNQESTTSLESVTSERAPTFGRYLLAIGACIISFILYGILCGVMRWKHGGGIIPILIFLYCIRWEWRAILRKHK